MSDDSDEDFFDSDSEDQNEDSDEEPNVIQKDDPKDSQKSENSRLPDYPIPLSKISFIMNVDGEKDLLDDGVSVRCVFKNRIVALKPIRSVLGCEKFDKKQEEIFRKEKSALLKQLNHENVLKYYGFCYLEGNMCIIVEHIEGGKPLFQFLKEVREGEVIVSSEEKVHIVSDIAEAVEYLQENSKLERSINPSNVSLSLRERKHGKWSAKISAFGVCQPSYNSSGSVVFHSAFVAPELLSPREFFMMNRIYTPQCDVYSVGVLIWCILSGYIPNVHRNHLNCPVDTDYDYYLEKMSTYSKTHTNYEPDRRQSVKGLCGDCKMLIRRISTGDGRNLGKIKKLRAKSMKNQVLKTFEDVPIGMSNEEFLEMVGKAFGMKIPTKCQVRLKGRRFITMYKPQENLEKFMKETNSSRKVLKVIVIPLAGGKPFLGADEMTVALRCKGIQIKPLQLESLVLLKESSFAQFHEQGKDYSWEFMRHIKKVSLGEDGAVVLVGNPKKVKGLICSCFAGKRTDMFLFKGTFDEIKKIPEYHKMLETISDRNKRFKKVKEDENIVGAAFCDEMKEEESSDEDSSDDEDSETFSVMDGDENFSLKIGGLVPDQKYTLLIQSYNISPRYHIGASLIIDFKT